MKNKILEWFEANKGELISGEELAEELGVTRAAVWKNIKSLRETGYDIESVKKKGYRLNPNSDILSLVKMQSHLKDKQRYTIDLHKTIDSTNKKAKLLAIELEKPWIVVASEEQQAGRAKAGEVFASPEGKGVYMSVVLMPTLKIEEIATINQVIDYAVIEGIRVCTGLEVHVTDNQEILYQNKKVGGILTDITYEAQTHLIQFIVVGIGINVYQSEGGYALSHIINRYCNRSELIAEILNHMSLMYKNVFGDAK